VNVRTRPSGFLYLSHWHGDDVVFRIMLDGTLVHIDVRDEGFVESPYLTPYIRQIESMIQSKFIVLKPKRMSRTTRKQKKS